MFNPEPNLPNAFYINQGNGTFTEPLFTTHGLGGSVSLLEEFSVPLGAEFEVILSDCP